MMVTSSQQQTGIMTGRRGSTVLRGLVGVAGGMGCTAALPILMVCTTTHPGPHISLGFCGTIGMVVNIP